MRKGSAGGPREKTATKEMFKFLHVKKKKTRNLKRNLTKHKGGWDRQNTCKASRDLGWRGRQKENDIGEGGDVRKRTRRIDHRSRKIRSSVRDETGESDGKYWGRPDRIRLLGLKAVMAWWGQGGREKGVGEVVRGGNQGTRWNRGGHAISLRRLSQQGGKELV